jgi:hypothetical protein
MSDAQSDRVGRRIGDIDDLPEALRKQLASPKLGDVESAVLFTLKNRYDGIATIDEMMVGVYRDKQVIIDDRKNFSNKLYRMQKVGLIESVPKRKGVYSLPKDAAEDLI